MADVYARITDVEPALVEQAANAMEISAADPQHRAMVEAYLGDLGLVAGTRALEIGCGTGAICRMLAAWPGVAEVVGVDPSPILLAKARQLGAAFNNLSFHQADGRKVPLEDASFDVVVLHRVLSHIPDPERVLTEAFRVLRSDGWLVAFDGDYATITLATGALDPLELCVAAFTPAYITDPWLVRRLPSLLRDVGFTVGRFRSHGYAQVEAPTYMLSIAERGADALAATGRIGRELADALKAEARRRVDAQCFFGHIAYASVAARKVASA